MRVKEMIKMEPERVRMVRGKRSEGEGKEELV